jgi:hypothetical protein
VPLSGSVVTVAGGGVNVILYVLSPVNCVALVPSRLLACV